MSASTAVSSPLQLPPSPRPSASVTPTARREAATSQRCRNLKHLASENLMVVWFWQLFRCENVQCVASIHHENVIGEVLIRHENVTVPLRIADDIWYNTPVGGVLCREIA